MWGLSLTSFSIIYVTYCCSANPVSRCDTAARTLFLIEHSNSLQIKNSPPLWQSTWVSLKGGNNFQNSPSSEMQGQILT